MKVRLILHLMEFLLALLYVIFIWPLYEGSESLWGGFICLGYLFVFAVYCGMNTFFIFMCIAGGVAHTVGRHQAMIYLVMCIIFAIVVYILFADSLGSFSCLPVIVPNCIYYLAQGIRTIHNYKDKMI